MKFRTTVFGVLTENGEKISNCELKVGIAAVTCIQWVILREGCFLNQKFVYKNCNVPADYTQSLWEKHKNVPPPENYLLYTLCYAYDFNTSY